MTTIGEHLNKTRTARQLTLEQAAAATHIRQRFLEALETDDWAALPSDVQGRGFLRLYASYLGLPVQPLLDAWSKKDLQVDLPDTPVIPEQPSQNEVPENPPDEKKNIPVFPESIPEESDKSISGKKKSRRGSSDSPNSQMIFDEIGAKLKQQREALGLPLNEVENYTHVRLHYLEAIENGRLDSLPSSVQAHGMLSNYARFLELDSEALLLRFADALQMQRLEQMKPKPRSSRSAREVSQPGTWRRWITPDLLVGSAIILLLLAVAIWSLTQVSNTGKNQGESTAPSIAEVLLRTPSPTSLTGQTATLDVSMTPLPGEGPTEGATLMANTITAVPNLENAALLVYVIANQRAFLRITSDGKVVFNDRVLPGNAYAFTGMNEIDLLTGNAAALQIYFNQKDLGILGMVGQVSNVVFTKNGVRTPTTLPSPSMTNTKPASPTPTGPTPTLVTPSVTPFIPSSNG